MTTLSFLRLLILFLAALATGALMSTGSASRGRWRGFHALLMSSFIKLRTIRSIPICRSW